MLQCVHTLLKSVGFFVFCFLGKNTNAIGNPYAIECILAEHILFHSLPQSYISTNPINVPIYISYSQIKLLWIIALYFGCDSCLIILKQGLYIFL